MVAGARGLKPQLGTVRFRGRVRSRYSAVSSLFALSFLVSITASTPEEPGPERGGEQWTLYPAAPFPSFCSCAPARVSRPVSAAFAKCFLSRASVQPSLASLGVMLLG